MTEKDTHGKEQNEPGAKLDDGKIRCGLVLGDFSKALLAVAEVGTVGAKKYTDHGWLTVPNVEKRYTDAMLRHYFDESSGERYAQDTTCLHAAHLAWNALARLELILKGIESES